MLTTTNLVGFASVAAAAVAPLAYVGLVGTPQSASATGTSLVITVGATIPAGDTVVVGGCCKIGTTITTVNDSKGNTYNTIVSTNDGTRANGLFYSTLTTPLVAGDTITLFYPGAGGQCRTMVAWQLTGAVAGTVHSDNITSTTTSFPLSIVNAAGACFYVTQANNSGETNAPPAGWTEDYDINGIGGSCSLGHKDTLVAPPTTTSCTVTRSNSTASLAIAGSLV